MRGGDHAGRAETALQRVMLAKRRLQRRQRVVVGKPLDRDHLGAFRLRGQHQAGAHGVAVDDHRAGAADAVLAADMGTSEPQMMTQAIGERGARLDIDTDRLAVDFEGGGHDLLTLVIVYCRWAASLKARSTMVPASERRYSALAWMSACASTFAEVISAARSIKASSTACPLIAASTSGIRRGRSPSPMMPTWAFVALPPASWS